MAGLAVTLWAGLHTGTLLSSGTLALTIPFGLVGTAGRWMLRGRTGARRLTAVAQLLQIPIILLPQFSWKFIAGAILSITMTEAETRMYLGVEATWSVGHRVLTVAPAVGLNILPLIALGCLFLVKPPPTIHDGLTSVSADR